MLVANPSGVGQNSNWNASSSALSGYQPQWSGATPTTPTDVSDGDLSCQPQWSGKPPNSSSEGSPGWGLRWEAPALAAGKGSRIGVSARCQPQCSGAKLQLYSCQPQWSGAKLQHSKRRLRQSSVANPSGVGQNSNNSTHLPTQPAISRRVSRWVLGQGRGWEWFRAAAWVRWFRLVVGSVVSVSWLGFDILPSLPGGDS